MMGWEEETGEKEEAGWTGQYGWSTHIAVRLPSESWYYPEGWCPKRREGPGDSRSGEGVGSQLSVWIPSMKIIPCVSKRIPCHVFKNFFLFIYRFEIEIR